MFGDLTEIKKIAERIAKALERVADALEKANTKIQLATSLNTNITTSVNANKKCQHPTTTTGTAGIVCLTCGEVFKEE